MSDESLPPLKKAFPRLREILGPQVMREIIEAAHGLKASRLCVLESRAARLVGALESCGLWVTLHDRKQLLFEDAGKGGWISGYGIETELEFPREGYLHLYAGRDPEAVLTAKKAEHSSDMAKFAEILAYPKCCAEFYSRNLETAESAQGDFILPLLTETMRNRDDASPLFPFWTNMAAQYFDYGLLSFYPCSFFCQEAIGKSKRALSLIQLYDAELAAKFVEVARSPVLYTEYEGVYRFLGARRRGNQISYRGVEQTLDGVLGHLLSSGDRIEVLSSRSVRVFAGDNLLASLDAPSLGMMIFDGDA